MDLSFSRRFEQSQSPIRKNRAAAEALRKLRSFLDTSEPELVYFLTRIMNNQQKAVTYKELREAILYGDVDPTLILDWQQDYTRFVSKYLEPAWRTAMDAATEELALKYPDWNFNPTAEGVRKWTETHGAEFVTNVTTTQIQGLRAVVQKAAVLQDMSIDHLSRAIRPMVGLTFQQSTANFRYYTNLLENGMKKEKALEMSIKYSAKQSRYRAYNIARTELAYAYNKGAHEGVKQAQAAGYMGQMEKVWCTADDERKCSICGALEGKPIAMDEDFDFNTKLEGRQPGIRQTPPAHPSCRCAVIYREVTPPTFKP